MEVVVPPARRDPLVQPERLDSRERLEPVVPRVELERRDLPALQVELARQVPRALLVSRASPDRLGRSERAEPLVRRDRRDRSVPVVPQVEPVQLGRRELLVHPVLQVEPVRPGRRALLE